MDDKRVAEAINNVILTIEQSNVDAQGFANIDTLRLKNDLKDIADDAAGLSRFTSDGHRIRVGLTYYTKSKPKTYTVTDLHPKNMKGCDYVEVKDHDTGATGYISPSALITKRPFLSMEGLRINAGDTVYRPAGMNPRTPYTVVAVHPENHSCTVRRKNRAGASYNISIYPENLSFTMPTKDMNSRLVLPGDTVYTEEFGDTPLTVKKVYNNNRVKLAYHWMGKDMTAVLESKRLSHENVDTYEKILHDFLKGGSCTYFKHEANNCIGCPAKDADFCADVVKQDMKKRYQAIKSRSKHV